MIQNPPESTLEYCVGPSYLVLSSLEYWHPSVNDSAVTRRLRLFIVTQSNFEKTLAVKESHDVMANMEISTNFEDSTSGKAWAFPKCKADWRMGEYSVQTNTTDQVSVMVCDQQILKARLTGERSIEAVLKAFRHQAKSWPFA